MNAALLSFWLTLHPGNLIAAPLPVWRVVNLPELHVGVRPAVLLSPGEVGGGFTVQVSGPWL